MMRSTDKNIDESEYYVKIIMERNCTLSKNLRIDRVFVLLILYSCVCFSIYFTVLFKHASTLSSVLRGHAKDAQTQCCIPLSLSHSILFQA